MDAARRARSRTIGVELGEEESSESDSEDRPLGAQFRADAAMKRKRACDDSDDDADDESD